jgi:hypothetical protein
VKILEITMCEHCPYFVIDPNDNIEFWGKNICVCSPNDIREIKNEKEIAEFCPLEDSKNWS